MHNRCPIELDFSLVNEVAEHKHVLHKLNASIKYAEMSTICAFGAGSIAGGGTEFLGFDPPLAVVEPLQPRLRLPPPQMLLPPPPRQQQEGQTRPAQRHGLEKVQECERCTEDTGSRPCAAKAQRNLRGMCANMAVCA